MFEYSTDTYQFLLLVSSIFGVGYCYYFIQGRFSERISKQPYNNLRNQKYFLSQLLISLLIAVVGYMIRQILFFMPISFLITFWLMNKITEIRTGEPLIFGTRWNAPKQKRFVASFNSFLVLVLTFAITLGIAVLVDMAKYSSSK